ncbi:MAG: TlpA disulfide reductase family protein [Acidobacteriota bacterium]
MISRLFSTVLALAAALPGAEASRPAPEYAVKLPSGQQLLLSQFRGKVVALEFLLTTCPACQDASRVMNQLHKEYGPRGFQPLGVAINEMAMMLVPDYVRDLQLGFPVGVGTRESCLDFLRHSAVLRMMMPQLVLIDRKGVIRGQYAGDDPFMKDKEKSLRAQVEALLNETAGAAGARKAKTPARSKTPSRAASTGPAGSVQ